VAVTAALETAVAAEAALPVGTMSRMVTASVRVSTCELRRLRAVGPIIGTETASGAAKIEHCRADAQRDPDDAAHRAESSGEHAAGRKFNDTETRCLSHERNERAHETVLTMPDPKDKLFRDCWR
jgi:hypothetical protein